jgi:L-cystine transport system substrate-binding protein
MKQKMLWGTLVAGILFVGIIVGNVAAITTQADDVLVATEGVYAPFSFHEEKRGNLTGYDVEVVKEIAKRVNLKFYFWESPWDGIFLGLESKKFDVIANEVAKTPEREQKYLFSDSYLTSGAQIIVRSDREGIKSLEDLKGLKVGTGVGSNYTKILEDFNAKNDQKIAIKYYDGNITTVLQDIVAGRLDATLNDRLTVGYNIKQLGLNVKPTGNPVALVASHFVFRKDPKGEALKANFDQGLTELKKDGTLAKLSKQWFGADYTQ